MRYPDVLTERETMRQAVFGVSIARFGDGELSLCLGGSSVSQQYDPALRKELCEILYGVPAGNAALLPCIPRLDPTGPRYAYWQKYATDRHTTLYRAPLFGSSFVTRPDNAPWIDRADYWDAVRSLWQSKTVTVVSGDPTLCEVAMSSGARGAKVIQAPKRNAYAVIDEIEKQIYPAPGRPVLIALGAAGTALAARLARKGLHALDLGHIGQFMKPENQGAFEFAPDQLASAQYRAQLYDAHATSHWGKGGHYWAAQLKVLCDTHGCGEVLDYGCGSGTLKPALAEIGVKCLEYDPGVKGKDVLPKLADLVASTDVFEHIEPELVDNVLAHTYRLARKVGFFAIAKQPAKKILADGRNAHLSCHETKWWVAALARAGWDPKKITVAEDAWKKCLIICTK